MAKLALCKFYFKEKHNLNIPEKSVIEAKTFCTNLLVHKQNISKNFFQVLSRS